MITISDLAVERLQAYTLAQGSPDAALRVFVAPGGCSGLQYGMTVEQDADEDDQVIETKGVRLFIDAFSGQYLDGSEVDFVDSLMGGGFTIHNPNAQAGCACGHSFTTGENEATANGCGCG